MASKAKSPEGRRILLVGSYTPPSGTGAGLSTFELGRHGELRAVGAPMPLRDPAYIVAHPSADVVYVTGRNSSGSGVVHSVGFTDGVPRVLNTVQTGSTGPCHLAIDSVARVLACAHFGGGSVSIHPIMPDGLIGERAWLQALDSTGDATDDRSRAHSTLFSRNDVGLVVADLGRDEVRRFEITAKDDQICLHEGDVAAMPSGSGPRHLLADGPGVIHATCENSSEVATLRLKDNGSIEYVSAVRSLMSDEDPPGRKNYPSHLLRAGSYIYVANRGADCLTWFSPLGLGLTVVGEVDCGGRTPRHIAQVGDRLYSANQDSDSITSFDLEPSSGTASPTGASWRVGCPTFMLELAIGL